MLGKSANLDSCEALPSRLMRGNITLWLILRGVIIDISLLKAVTEVHRNQSIVRFRRIIIIGSEEQKKQVYSAHKSRERR